MQYIRFNYIAFKVTDVAHIPYSTPYIYGTDPNQHVLSIGVNDVCGKIPVNVNWDLEQDFTFTKGHEGVVDPEGFAQHPGTKQMRPTDKKPISFVYRVPKPWKQFISTDIVKNSTKIDLKFADFMADVTGIKNIRAPGSVWFSVPEFWGKLLPTFGTQGNETADVRTYIRGNAYLGVTFRGRRLMDDGTCTVTTCNSEVEISLPEDIALSSRQKS